MKRYMILGFALLALVLIYLFQRVSYADMLNSILPEVLKIRNANAIFIFNRTVRLILNDTACMVIIWTLFQQTKFLKAAFLVFLVELLIILPLYFTVKLSLEGDSELSSPFLSQIHRMIVNPLLMFLLMFGFLYQKLNPNPSPRWEGLACPPARSFTEAGGEGYSSISITIQFTAYRSLNTAYRLLITAYRLPFTIPHFPITFRN